VTDFKIPQFPQKIVWTKLPDSKFTSDSTYDDLLIETKSFPDTNTDNIHINCGLLKKITLSKSKFNKLKLLDVKIIDSNLSNLISYDANFIRVEISKSKLTGLQLLNPILEHVCIEGSNAQYLQLRFGNCHKVIFKNCDLKGSDFTGTNLTSCEFINCDLTDSEFSGAKLQGTDLRGSNLEKVHIGISEIKGAIVNTSQALYLTGILGIDIRD
jgi:uncharacterized protein YjbI with pentapeptide repeats